MYTSMTPNAAAAARVTARARASPTPPRRIATTTTTTTSSTSPENAKTSFRSRSVGRRARLPPPRAGWSDFVSGVKREIDITFNPRTAGAKIAGRCPDTQTVPNEVERQKEIAEMEAMESDGSDENIDGFFDLAAFTRQLEEQVRSQNDAADAVDVAEQKVHAELAARLAEVNDGWVPAAAEAALDATATEAADDDSSRGPYASLAKSDRQRQLEVAYYGADYVGEGVLTGRELALLCYAKYGKYHDMAVKHVRMGEGMKRWVSLNLYVGHLGQRSYPATEEEYLAGLDSIAYMITSWGQADYARAFFREPPIARRGLPSRPRVDTCVTLQFNRSPTWDDEMGDEFFTY